MPTPDPHAFTSPSHIRVLLAPVGRIKRAKFYGFVERLQAANIVRLGDVSPDTRGTRTTFSPLSFPNGQVVYNLTTAYDHEHEYLDGLEMHRRTYMVIAIADFTERNTVHELREAIRELHFQYPKSLLIPLLIFDTPISDELFSRSSGLYHDEGEESSNPEEYPKLTVAIPSKYESSATSIKTVMCDLTSLLLFEFAGLAKSLQALPTIPAPTMNPEERMSKPMLRMSMPVGGATSPGLAGGPGVGSRQTMTGFGSGSLTERERNKGKARVKLAVANLHLMAGMAQDAYREYTEGALAAKTNSDYLWHGKALEGIGVSLLTMAFMGLEFQIPTVVFPPTTQLADAKSKSSGTATSATPGTPAALFTIIPELLNTILGLYSRSGTFNSEHAPAVVQSDTIIRFCKLMVIAQQCHGLTKEAMSHIVLGTPLPTDLGKPQVKGLARADIAGIVMKAYPNNLPNLTMMDAAGILGGIAAVLDKIGFKRKKAMVTRELLKLLVPSLIQARVVGAAESGMHPSSSTVEEFRPPSRNGPARPGSPTPNGTIPLDGDDADIVRTSRLLDDLCSAYGISTDTLAASLESSTEEEKNLSLQKSLAESGRLRQFGWLSLKVGVLRSCILLSEAIPDYEAVLHYTTQLLEIAGTELSKGEQGKLAESFTRTVGVARKSGMDEDLTGVADYWDDYLLREVELVESQIWKPPIPHAAAELSAVVDAVKNPFIYNPFASKHTTATSLSATTIKTLLVEGEPTDFLVTLQNPFDFEIQIDSFAIDASGVDFETLPAGIVIGPYRQQTYIITGIPRSTGTMKVLGARIRVYGCKERFFAIIPDIRNAVVEGADKIKRVGLGALTVPQVRPKSQVSTNGTPVRASQVPQTKIGPDLKQISINVIPAQPKLTITHTSLPQNAVMILEGEKQIFTVHVKNESDSVAVDFVTVSFTDSTTEPVTNAIAQKQAFPAEVYELEVILYKKKAFEWIQPEEYINIGPGEEGVFEVEVLGKPGLTNGKVVVDYGFIDRDGKETKEAEEENSGRWYTRRVETGITVTVNASVELVRMDFLPWSKMNTSLLLAQSDLGEPTNDSIRPTPAANNLLPTSQLRDEQIRNLFSRLARLDDPSSYCLVLIDVRNSWPHPLRISMSYTPPTEDIEEQDVAAGGKDDLAYTATDTIPAGHSTRLILPLKRIYIEHPTAAIPSLSKTQRQYVVSMTKVSPEVERMTREGFWYKEAILGRISGTWEEVGTGRGGAVECRNFRMSGTRGIDAVRVEDVDIGVSVESSLDGDGVVGRIGKSKWGIKTDEFFKIKVRVKNRGARKVRMISRLLPCLKFVGGSSGNTGLELTRRAGFNGTLQKSLGWVRSGEERVVEMGMVIIASGEYEILGCVEEVKGDDYDEEDEDGDKGPREPLEVEQRLLEELIKGEKKVWYAREVCSLVASD